MRDFAAKHGVALQRDTHLFPACGVPKTLLKLAIEKRKSLLKEDERNFQVWMVTDVDEHGHEMCGIIQEARKQAINLIISNPCIELWGLYHFTPYPTAALDRHQAQRELEQKMPGYDKDKGKRFDLNRMFPLHKEAVKRAKEVLKRAEAEDPHPNPSSNFYALLEAIEKNSSRDPLNADPAHKE
ncbi:MAG: RloB family protein [Magnetococcus sp. YQC-9]